MTQFFGRIEDDTIREIINFDPQGRFHPLLIWEQVPESVTVGMTRQAGVWGVSPLPSPTRAGVEAERRRRLALGFDYDFGDARGVHRIGTTKEDMEGWDEVTTLADALRALGQTTPISILTETGPAQVMPDEWAAILLAAAAFRQPIWGASFTLAAMNPIPADFADDSHWPPVV